MWWRPNNPIAKILRLMDEDLFVNLRTYIPLVDKEDLEYYKKKKESKDDE